jgi:hypothetical protein
VKRNRVTYRIDNLTPAELRAVYLLLIYKKVNGRACLAGLAVAICAAYLAGLVGSLPWLLIAAQLAALAAWDRLTWSLWIMAGDLWAAWEGDR